MECIADIGLEPETELDKSFRNGINEDDSYGYKVEDYLCYLSQEDIDNIKSMIYRLRFNKISKLEVESFTLAKFGEYNFTDVEHLIRYLNELLLFNQNDFPANVTTIYYEND